MGKDMIIGSCPCGSNKHIGECCGKSLAMINLALDSDDISTVLIDWKETYSKAINDSFNLKAKTYLFRVSKYLDAVLELYLDRNYPSLICHIDDTNELFWCQKHNVLLTISAASQLLSCGLFLQSGILLRTAMESIFVLLEMSCDHNCFELLKKNKYPSHSILRRMKKLIPSIIIEWYGYLSANFTHTSDLHQSAYLPRACYPDNYVIISGIQNILRTIIAFHVIMERAYFNVDGKKFFWKNEGELTFDDDNDIFKWMIDLGGEINKEIPIDYKPFGMHKSRRATKLKY